MLCKGRHVTQILRQVTEAVMSGYSEGVARFDYDTANIADAAALLGGKALLGRHASGDPHELVQRGIPAMALDHLLDGLTVLERGQLLDALGMSVRTLQRYRESPGRPLSRERSDRVWSFAEILARAIEAFGSKEEAERWLDAPAFALGQRRPLDLLSTSAGTARVATLLTQIEYGVYV